MKNFFVILSALLIGGVSGAQDNAVKPTPKSFFAFQAGTTIPTGMFNSKALHTDGFFGGGGFAQVGFGLDMRYEYRFSDNVGITGMISYNNNGLHSDDFVREINRMYFEETGESLNAEGLTLDHWQWYSFLAGPVFIKDFSKNVIGSIRITGGLASANSARATFMDEEIFGEDWSNAFVFRGGADIRFGLGKNTYGLLNIDYMYLRPEFKISMADPFTSEVYWESGKQEFAVLGLSAGIGVRF